LLGMEGHIKFRAGMLVGAMMLSLIFQFYSCNKHRQVSLCGSLVATNKAAPTLPSANKHGAAIDPTTEMRCGEVNSEALCLSVIV
jgi:hypothetical protein